MLRRGYFTRGAFSFEDLRTTNTCGCKRDVVKPKRHVLPRVVFPAQLEVCERGFPVGFLIDPSLIDIGCGSSIDDEPGDFRTIDPRADRACRSIHLKFNTAPFIGRQNDTLADAYGAQGRQSGVIAFPIPHEDFILAAHAEILVFDAIMHRHERGVSVVLSRFRTHIESAVKRIAQGRNRGRIDDKDMIAVATFAVDA